MMVKKIDIQQWQREAPARSVKIEKALAGFKPPQRHKPRSAFEAEFLRRVGTPERLIGPTTTSPERRS
jgi:hypothetical protein